MKQRSKLILLSSCIAAFLAAFLLATFYDYQISEAISRLTEGKYLSDNLFGRFFETFGESPLYIIGGFAAANLARGSLKVKGKVGKICLTCLCISLGVLAYFLFFQRTTEYACEHLGKVELYEKIETFVSLGALVLAVAGMALTLYLAFKIPEKYLKGLIAFSVCVLFTVILAQGVVQGIKGVFGRQRYRTMKVLEYYGLNEMVDYTKWFVINGERTVGADLLALGIASDGYKSFPSGHTCAAAIVFTLTFLPDFLGIEEPKRVKIKGILIAVAFLYTFLVALSRVVMGAHFATDVLFGGGWTYLSAVISSFIAKKIFKN